MLTFIMNPSLLKWRCFSVEVIIFLNRKRMTDVPHQKRTKCPFKYLLALTLINYHLQFYSIYAHSIIAANGQSKK